jgi:hypothetical protein
MRLLLRRRYTPRGTPGRLFLGSSQLCFIREAPKACFGGAAACLAEGVYELRPVHTEAEGWKIRIGDQGWIRSRPPEHSPSSDELCPVTAYRADGTPLFTRLAFLKLLDELGSCWEKGEVVELQVVSREVAYKRETCRIQSLS